MTSWGQKELDATKQERERIVKMLRSYYELTQEPNLDGDTEVNEDWDCGFRAAIAIITNEYNHPRQERP
jgi:hypothetical protein